MRPLVLALALVACGGDDDSSSSSSSSASSGSTSGATSSSSTSSSSGTATSTSSSSSGATSSTSSGSASTVANVTGLWMGGGKNVGSYLDLAQSGANVTGTACEAPGKDCYPIVDGLVAGQRFTAKYSWEEGGTQTVTMDLTVAADGRSMAGTYVATKCNCTLQVALGKQN